MNFAQIVRSSKLVRNTFDSLPTHKWWWGSILSLHGKPTRVNLNESERKQILSKGFTFYAYLYSILAVIFAALALILIKLPVNQGYFWTFLSFLSSLYLSASSAIAFKGAKIYLQDTVTASGLLVVFFVAITGFLMFFGGAFVVGVGHYLPESSLPSLLFLILFVTFGVSSYLLEILFLVYSASENGLSGQNES